MDTIKNMDINTKLMALFTLIILAIDSNGR